MLLLDFWCALYHSRVIELQDFTSPLPQTKRFFLTFACKCGIIFRWEKQIGRRDASLRPGLDSFALQWLWFRLFFAAPQRAQFHGGLSPISGILEQNGSLLFQLPRTQTKEGSTRQVYSSFIQVESLLPPCGTCLAGPGGLPFRRAHLD